MNSTAFLMKYASRRESRVRSALDLLVTPIVKTSVEGEKAHIHYKGESVQLNKCDFLFQAIAEGVLSNSEDRFFDLSISDDCEVWSTSILSGALVALINRYEWHLSRSKLSRERVKEITAEAMRSGVIDVVFDPTNKCYQGKTGLLYLFLKAKGENPSYKRTISSSTAEAGDSLIDFLESFGGSTTVAIRDVESFVLHFEDNFIGAKARLFEDILKDIGIDPKLWWRRTETDRS